MIVTMRMLIMVTMMMMTIIITATATTTTITIKISCVTAVSLVNYPSYILESSGFTNIKSQS